VVSPRVASQGKTKRRLQHRWEGHNDHHKARRELAPAQIFVASFVGLIAVGTLALKYLPGIYQGEGLSWTDAIFTSTSAVCVTGLIVVDTATYFTAWGQVLILVLIQLGGFGMLLLASFVITALGGRPSLRTESMASNTSHMLPSLRSSTLIVDVVRFTLVIEAIGAIALYLLWIPKLGWQGAAWPAVFHAVSAFCNAGFSTYTTSLIDFQTSPATLIVISCLVIAGGLGFIPMEEIYQRYVRQNRAIRRISIHSKLAIAASCFLLLSAWPAFAAFEWNGLFSRMSVFDTLVNSLFLSVTPRTAGFNSIDYAFATDSTNFLTIILMMIGGSPGSTAGGLKTTTIALLVLFAWSRLRSSPTCTFANRSIPEETIQRAAGLFAIGIGIVVTSTLLLTSINDLYGLRRPFIANLFEVVSAFNTVGLSMGVTPELSNPARWLTILLMFAGRTGPLALAAALAVRMSSSGKFRLAYEDVVVG
jgi:trk system potassium uptake protein